MLLKNRLGHDFREGVGRGQYAKSDGVLLENRLGHYFREGIWRGQYAKSEGVLLQNKLPRNSQDGQHGQDDPADRPEMRSFGADRGLTSRAGGQDYVSSQANSLKLSPIQSLWSPIRIS